jgi:beta-N-acetylhexosaminidase
VIFGLAGTVVREAERALFAAADPLGFILFARNCESPAQVSALVRDLRAIVGRADAPVLIDQEGGRVQRLRPPHWRDAPAAGVIGRLAQTDEAAAVEAAWLNGRLLAAELAALGISVDCAPVLDLAYQGADAVIGDRAYAADPERVALLGRASCAGLLAGGVLPVIKHVPGHGRARVNSHRDLPVVEAPAHDLERTDFAPFLAMNHMPWAMTAHIVFSAIDPDRPATLSARVIADAVRGTIGFGGVLVSDDIGMGALKGPTDARASAALEAGCDLVLHCSGDLAEMHAVAAACGPLADAAADRLTAAEEMRAAAEDPAFDAADARARLQRLLAAAGGAGS